MVYTSMMTNSGSNRFYCSEVLRSFVAHAVMVLAPNQKWWLIISSVFFQTSTVHFGRVTGASFSSWPPPESQCAAGEHLEPVWPPLPGGFLFLLDTMEVAVCGAGSEIFRVDHLSSPEVNTVDLLVPFAPFGESEEKDAIAEKSKD